MTARRVRPAPPVHLVPLGEPLPSWSRADLRTCSTRCHVAAWRAHRRANANALVHDGTPGMMGPSRAIGAVTSASEPRAA